jgi:hypothetical protein
MPRPPAQPDYSETRWSPWHTCLTGLAHRKEGSNCQDATAFAEGNRIARRSRASGEYRATGRWLAACVSDGVGSYHHSEVGARMTVNIALNHVRAGLQLGETPPNLGPRVARGLVKDLNALARLCGENWQHACYATVILAVGTVDWFAVWACGDGFYGIGDGPAQDTGPLVPLPVTRQRGRDAPLDPPPTFRGGKAMDSWGRSLRCDLDSDGQPYLDRLRDDLGLCAFVPRGS